MIRRFGKPRLGMVVAVWALVLPSLAAAQSTATGNTPRLPPPRQNPAPPAGPDRTPVVRPPANPPATPRAGGWDWLWTLLGSLTSGIRGGAVATGAGVAVRPQVPTWITGPGSQGGHLDLWRGDQRLGALPVGSDPSRAPGAAEAYARQTGQPVDFVLYQVRLGQNVWVRVHPDGRRQWWDPWGPSGWQLRDEDPYGYTQGFVTNDRIARPRENTFGPEITGAMTGFETIRVHAWDQARIGHHPVHGALLWDSWRGVWTDRDNYGWVRGRQLGRSGTGTPPPAGATPPAPHPPGTPGLPPPAPAPTRPLRKSGFLPVATVPSVEAHAEPRVALGESADTGQETGLPTGDGSSGWAAAEST